MKKTACGQVSR